VIDNDVDVSSELNRTLHHLDAMIQRLRDNVTQLRDEVSSLIFIIIIIIIIIIVIIIIVYYA